MSITNNLKLLFFLSLITSIFCYLELALQKYELKNYLKETDPIICITKQMDTKLQQIIKKQKQNQRIKKQKQKQNYQQKSKDDETIDNDQISQKQNYHEICYEKDIAYSLPIYLNNKINMISLDTTVPISWFKGQGCHIQASSKKCSLVTSNLKEKITKMFKKKPKRKHNSINQYAIIEGSSQLVKGRQQKGKDFIFTTRDSSRLTNIFQLLMLGFYMKGEKDTVSLVSTNFINATEISNNLNYLCDGAISLRFDNQSQNSFLKELIEYQNTKDKYITIYIDNKGDNFITVGQLASKYSQNGYGGIEWIDITEDQKYGKLPIISNIIIENEGSKYSQKKQKSYPSILSLSASYIGIPTTIINEWLTKFSKKSNCQINILTKYLQCKHLKQKDQNKIITFQFLSKKISFKFNQLIINQSQTHVIFNIKQTIQQKYIVLGQPLFNKYLIVFDYENNKVGIGQKRIKSELQFINVVSVTRFICLVFGFGCSFLLCFLPIKYCFQTFKQKTRYGFRHQNRGEVRRLRQYAPIQENPYDQLNVKINQALKT